MSQPGGGSSGSAQRNRMQIQREINALERNDLVDARSRLQTIEGQIEDLETAKTNLERLIRDHEQMETRVRTVHESTRETRFAGSRRRRVEGYLRDAGDRMQTQRSGHEENSGFITTEITRLTGVKATVNNEIAGILATIEALRIEQLTAPAGI